MVNTIKKILSIFALYFFSILSFSQTSVDFGTCDVPINYDSLKLDFIEKPSCEKYVDICYQFRMCFKRSIDDVELMYVAAKQCNCSRAYFDLYAFYKKLNYKLSYQTDCNEETLLLNNLDEHSRKIAIESLIKTKMNKIDDLAIFYYYGIYVKKDREKAIQLIKNSYAYRISDGEAEKYLIDMKSRITPCEK